MNLTAALDISTFIWSKEDYNNNPEHYYPLMSIIPKVFEEIKKFKIPILMRNELYIIISNDFPYPYLNKFGYSYYATKILRLLTTTQWSTYEEKYERNFSSTPVIIKEYFTKELINECNNQIIHLFNNSIDHKFISCKHFYNSNNNLVVYNPNKRIEIDTLAYSSEEDIMQFFDKHKIKFRHNPKHDRYKSGGKVSPLSCFNERTGDITKAQDLLEKAYKVGDDFYYYDEENYVYIQFVASNDNTYHGFDISDDKNNVPYQIKRKFNKDGRTF